MLLILLSVPASAEDGPEGFCRRVRHHFEAEARAERSIPDGAVIGRVDLRVLDVFDLGREDENRRAFRMANRLHVNTRSQVIERKLLFGPGDPFDRRILEETERYLRSQSYLYDVCIAPVAVRGREVDVAVVTRDVWTLGVSGGVERSGGANTLQFELKDSNFLGSGRYVSMKYVDDPDRTERLVRYIDPALFGSRAELAVKVAQRSDGHRRTLDLARPFFSLDTRWSVGGRWVSDEVRVKRYSQGDVVERFFRDASYLELRGGLSPGYDGRGTRRLLFGFTRDETRFFEELEGLGVDPEAAATAAPAGRTLAYPWVELRLLRDGFIEKHNVDQLVRTEDMNLGTDLRLRLGWSSSAFGADRDQALVDSRWSRGLRLGPDQYLLLRAWGGGRFGDEGPENVLAGAALRHFFTTFGEHQFFTTLRFDAARNLDPENQLLLGGDSGLRGYPLRFRDGDRRLLLSLEQRFYSDLELFNVVHVGAAAFFDMGRAWYAGSAGPAAGEEWLRNVGIGLRLGSSRSSTGRMIHLDLAYPLDGDERKLQWLVTSKQSF